MDRLPRRRIPGPGRPGRPGRDRRPLPAQDDPDAGRLRARLVVHALAGGELSSPPFSVRAAGCCWLLLVLSVMGGLYLASLMAESLVAATYTLPADIERLAGQVSGRITDLIRDQPYLRGFLPEPGTIDRLGDTNRALLIEKLSYGLTDFTIWVAQGFVILVLVIFMLIESEMLSTKVIRFFARNGTEAAAAGTVLVADHSQDPRLSDRPDADQRRVWAWWSRWPSGP